VSVKTTVSYLRSRLEERSFWGDVLVGISAAAVLPQPWCFVFAVMSAIKALVPDAPKVAG
jgi:hypothetical protein